MNPAIQTAINALNTASDALDRAFNDLNRERPSLGVLLDAMTLVDDTINILS